MTHDQLIVLQAIVETGSFKAASQRLHRSQPAVSVSIKKLEEEFGIRLFSRDAYRPVLTREGQAFYEKARAVLREAGALETFAKHLSSGEEPEIRIAVESITPLPLVLGFFRRFFDARPMTRLNLTFKGVGGSREMLLDGQVDFALTPILEDHPHIEYKKIIRSSAFLVCASDFPPAKLKKELKPEEMRPYVQVVFREPGPYKTERTFFAPIEGGRHWVVNDYKVKRDLILSGLGWGSVPAYDIDDELKEGKLVPLKVKGMPPLSFDVCLVRRSDLPNGPVARQLWDSMIQEMESPQKPVRSGPKRKKKR